MLEVYTTRMDPRVTDIDALDITRSGADRGTRLCRGIGGAFAPSAQLLLPYIQRSKRGEATEEDWLRYAAAYLNEMRESYRRRPPAWEQLLGWQRVVLLCYCTDSERCHRTLLGRDILPKLGANFHGEL